MTVEMNPEQLAKAGARLEFAIIAHRNARDADNAWKTPATKRAREAAVVELELAARKVAELTTKEFGL